MILKLAAFAAQEHKPSLKKDQPFSNSVQHVTWLYRVRSGKYGGMPIANTSLNQVKRKSYNRI